MNVVQHLRTFLSPSDINRKYGFPAFVHSEQRGSVNFILLIQRGEKYVWRGTTMLSVSITINARNGTALRRFWHSDDSAQQYVDDAANKDTNQRAR